MLNTIQKTPCRRHHPPRSNPYQQVDNTPPVILSVFLVSNEISRVVASNTQEPPQCTYGLHSLIETSRIINALYINHRSLVYTAVTINVLLERLEAY